MLCIFISNFPNLNTERKPGVEVMTVTYNIIG